MTSPVTKRRRSKAVVLRLMLCVMRPALTRFRSRNVEAAWRKTVAELNTFLPDRFEKDLLEELVETDPIFGTSPYFEECINDGFQDFFLEATSTGYLQYLISEQDALQILHHSCPEITEEVAASISKFFEAAYKTRGDEE